MLPLAEMDLLNLHVGAKKPSKPWCEQDIGPWRVSIVDNYDSIVGDLQMDGWIATASATAVHAHTKPESVLLGTPDQDSGEWDLCELLTFITGRRVTTRGNQDRYSARASVRLGASCVSIETLAAAALAWDHREALVQRRMQYSMLLINEASDHRSLQTLAALHNTALNIIVDAWPVPADAALTKAMKGRLADTVEAAVDSCELSLDVASDMKKVLRGRIYQGSQSATERLTSVLAELGVISAIPNAGVLLRVSKLNSCRNSFTHTGRIRELPGLSRKQSEDFAFAATIGVVPSICRLAIGRILGFTHESLGSLSQDTDELRQFFETGRWRWGLVD